MRWSCDTIGWWGLLLQLCDGAPIFFTYLFQKISVFSERKTSYSLRLDPHLLCLDCDEESQILQIMKLLARYCLPSQFQPRSTSGRYRLKFIK